MRLFYAMLLASLALYKPSLAQDIFMSVMRNGGNSVGIGPGGLQFMTSDGQVLSNKTFPQMHSGYEVQNAELTWFNNKAYGVMYQGGDEAIGVMYCWDPAAQTYTVLHHFGQDDPLGFHPVGGLTLKGTALYGTCAGGGAFGDGTVFKYDTQNLTFSVVHAVDVALNFTLFGHLLSDATGTAFYGVSYSGGNAGNGAVFRIDEATGQMQILHHFFMGWQGYHPVGGVCLGPGGDLYVLCAEGGQYANGSIVKIDPSSQVMQHCYSFGNISPNSGNRLIATPDGMMVAALQDGASSGKRGLVRFNPYTQQADIFSPFNSASGGNIMGVLSPSSSGSYYAITQLDVNFQNLIEIPSDFNSFSILWDSLAGKKGTSPLQIPSGEILAVNATTLKEAGGTLSRFSWNPDPIREVLPLNHAPLGLRPEGPLCLASNGLYYGLCAVGRYPEYDLGYGGGFSWNPQTGELLPLFQYQGSTVRSGNARLIEYSPGVLYAVLNGATGGRPRIIRYEIATGSLNVVANFGVNDGKLPGSTLFKASDGLLYGVCSEGGGSGSIGTLFSFDPATQTLAIRYRFNSFAIVSQPMGELCEPEPGILMGTTRTGGAGADGTIYRFPISGSTAEVLATFNGTNGSEPLGGMVETSPGIWYGTVSAGGNVSNSGGIFRFNYAAQTIVLEAPCNMSVVQDPEGTLVMGSDGALYGVGNGVPFSPFYTAWYRYVPGNTSFELLRGLEGNDLYGAYSNHQVQAIQAVIPRNVPAMVCKGDTLELEFIASPALPSGTVMQVELSDAEGHFIAPSIIGTGSSEANVLTCVIPAGLVSGADYRIRVRALDLPYVPIDNGFSIPIGTATDATIDLIASNDAPYCIGETVVMQAVVNPISDYRLEWWVNGSLVAGSEALQSITLNTSKTIQVKVFPQSGCYHAPEYDSVEITLTPSTTIPFDAWWTETAWTRCNGQSDVPPMAWNSGAVQPSIIWYLNGVEIPESMVMSTADPSWVNGVLTADLSSDVACAQPHDVTLTALSVELYQSDTVMVFQNLMQGDSVFLQGAWQHEAGVYYDFYSNSAGCDSVRKVVLDVITSHSATISSLTELWPNPTLDYCTIRSSMPQTQIWTLTDMQGRTLLQGTMQGMLHLDLRDLAPGVYVFRSALGRPIRVLRST